MRLWQPFLVLSRGPSHARSCAALIVNQKRLGAACGREGLKAFELGQRLPAGPLQLATAPTAASKAWVLLAAQAEPSFVATMWAVAGLLLTLLASASAASFENATVDGVHAITSEWGGGLCGSIM